MHKGDLGQSTPEYGLTYCESANDSSAYFHETETYKTALCILFVETDFFGESFIHLAPDVLNVYAQRFWTVWTELMNLDLIIYLTFC